MIKSKVKFGSGSVQDLYETYKLVHLESDNVLNPPIKDFESTSYPEEHGEHVYPKTVAAPLDYKVKLLVMCKSGEANRRISNFNNAMFTTQSDSDVRTYKTVTFYNAYNGETIVGYPQPLSGATSFYRDKSGRQQDAVVMEWKIRIHNPSLCTWASS